MNPGAPRPAGPAVVRGQPAVNIQNLTPPSGAADIQSSDVPVPSIAGADRVHVPIALHGGDAVGPPAPAVVPEKRGVPVLKRMDRYWQNVGGGSLVLSVAIHALAVTLAYLLVKTATTEKEVEIVSVGHSHAGGLNSLEHRIDSHRTTNRLLNKTHSMRRTVVSCGPGTPIPGIPLVTLAAPEMGILESKMGDGGFLQMTAQGGMTGGTSGGRIGAPRGSAQALSTHTVFGRIGGTGLPGTLYDLKQDRDRQPVEYDVSQFAGIIAGAASKQFAASAMKPYFKASQEMNFTFLAVPYMSAEEGPRAFKVENEVQPRGWFVHYSGTITAPQSGEWRFVGNFDDALVIYINGKPVLDGSWLVIGNHGARQPDEDIRQSFGGPPVLTRNQRCWAGKWVKLDGPAKVDIIVGERPGGKVGGVLLVQHRKSQYRLRPDGSPILPVLMTSPPELADFARMKAFSEAGQRFELEMNIIPVFQVGQKTLREGGSALDKMNDRLLN